MSGISRTLAIMVIVFLPACQSERATPSPEPASLFRDDSAERVAATSSPQIIEFYATYCTECIALRPTLYELEEAYTGQVDFIFLDSDNPANQSVKERFRYVAHPHTLLIAPDGSIIHQWYGHNSEADFRAEIDKYLASSE